MGERINGPQRILLIEDEKPIADAVAYNLRRSGYSITVARDGETGLSLARTENPDLVILDLMLPGIDGMAVCRALRAGTPFGPGRAGPTSGRVPIIMLTAKAEEVDCLVGFEMGADDYVTKPFSMRELLARVKAVLSRATPSPAGAESIPRITCGDLALDADAHTVTRGTEPVALRPREFELLAFLMRNQGRVLQRATLLERVWGDSFTDPHTVDVHIRWLREKLETTPGKPQRILTVRGVGYKFIG